MARSALTETGSVLSRERFDPLTTSRRSQRAHAPTALLPAPLPTLLRTLLTALVAGLVAGLALTLASPAPASALRADRVPRAQHRILGSHLTNHHTHVETWIIGYYHYARRVRIHRHLRKKRFYGLRASAQHCNRHRCWGRTVEGRLWSPHQPGRPPAKRRSVTKAASGDLCIQGTTACAAPWNWFAKYVDTRQRELVRRFVNPCAKGSLEGGGVVAATDLSARILFEGGVLTAARAGSAFAGPPGIALGALGGCMVGEAAGGLRTVKALIGKLNPFDREATRRG
jgi:hypothetical protein